MIIVIGGNHHNTLGVIRSLGERKIKSDVIIHDCKKSFVVHSKFVRKKYLCTKDVIVQILIKEYAIENNKHIIICCSDISSSIVDLNKELLSERFILPGCIEHGRITSLMDKYIMSNIAVGCGITVPVSVTTNVADLSTRDDIVYPCILKPLLSIKGTKKNIHVCSKRKELLSIINSIDNIHYQIQQFIEKEFEFQLIGCSLNYGKDVIIPAVSIIIRNGKNTNTGFLKIVPVTGFENIIELSKSFIKKIGYQGLFSMEFLRGKDGSDYFMEINFRNDGNAYSVTASGTNLPYIWIMQNSNFEKEVNRIEQPVYIMPELSDIKLIMLGKLKLTTWIKDINRTKSFLLFNRHDIKPFLFKLIYLIK